jgi:CoA binding domain
MEMRCVQQKCAVHDEPFLRAADRVWGIFGTAMIAEETPPQTAPAARALDPIFSPRSIAVVGASRRRDSIGFALLHNLVTSEFSGAIFPVNPEARAIHSLRSATRASPPSPTQWTWPS